jgi:hypothetical protein
VLSTDLVKDIITLRKLKADKTFANESFSREDIDLESLQLRVNLEVEDAVQAIIVETVEDIANSKIRPVVAPMKSGTPKATSLASPAFDISKIGEEDYIANLHVSYPGLGSSGGVLCRTVECLLAHKSKVEVAASPFGYSSTPVHSDWPESVKSLTCFEHIETPIQQLKRAGLGLLSQGLGRSVGMQIERFFCANLLSNRLGFAGASMSSRPHPAAQSTIVIIVIGGISLKEVTEVQNEIRKHYEKNPGTAPVKIILGSTCITSPDVMFKQLFCK